MRIAFMGSPAFAVPALNALVDVGHTIVAVYCQPPRPAGRGHRARPCAVQEAAERLGLRVRTPARLRNNTDEQAAFAALDLDAAVVAAYGLILPQAMLSAPRRGCLNIHASLLPRHRGASPIQAAILAGDTASGVSIMRMEEGLDTGPVLLMEATPITARTTTPDLHDRLAAIGAGLIVRALAEYPPALPQDDAAATYAPKLGKADGVLDWSLPADALDRRVRALNPWPGTTTLLDGAPLKVLDAIHTEVMVGGAAPGTVLDRHLSVACGDGRALRLSRVQAAGRAATDADAFLRGRPVPPGTRLG